MHAAKYWNTVEMHTEKVLEHNRNTRKKCWNTVKVYTEKVLVCKRNTRMQCWNTVGLHPNSDGHPPGRRE